MFEVKGVMVLGAPGREVVYTVARVTTVPLAGLMLSVDQLLRKVSCREGVEELLQNGAVASVTVTRSSASAAGVRLTGQLLKDAERAEEEIAAAHLREGEFSSRWTINHPEAPTNE